MLAGPASSAPASRAARPHVRSTRTRPSLGVLSLPLPMFSLPRATSRANDCPDTCRAATGCAYASRDPSCLSPIPYDERLRLLRGLGGRGSHRRQGQRRHRAGADHGGSSANGCWRRGGRPRGTGGDTELCPQKSQVWGSTCLGYTPRWYSTNDDSAARFRHFSVSREQSAL